ncbi:MAG: hypothetical protein ACYDCC_12600 [Actinomycetota bacterium]
MPEEKKATEAAGSIGSFSITSSTRRTYPTDYHVIIPSTSFMFYRWLRSDAPQRSDFIPNHDLPRRQVIPVEDAAMYRGLSTWGDLDRAISAARNRTAALKGKGRQGWTHVARAETDPAFLHACAETRTPGHWTIWGEPDEFLKNVQEIFSIDG